ncbi:hypothetical protein WZ78_09505 [Leuconostoc mesenteroides subsp. dextranicum]|jgi:hypothetical protein|uniref:hypothetical protein n=1 Tax=Leuconostoc TaxID=1243 RepID=UPI00068225C2|nr:MULTISPECIES: hypothetical protein [Leuconostoc]MCI2140238.1 hypothetical protein [Lactococcus lactis]KAA8371355.1 hypothetical protein FE415_09165 [Leuconostoc carnosum]KMY80378.1 hypothetical protein WZ78_09505 [Leuconostoc mesenteroides subsp. dextranicum]MBZ1503366.1 hypothetical protein [Leuconostoc mesenteroides]MCM6827879.1 hypothetical protein [Leuconostoc mesenteroides]
MTNNEIEVLASELPILDDKQNYKYIDEIASNGAYYQVAWIKKQDKYLALYGTTPIKLKIVDTSNDVFEDEEV